jgi:hypothetical protein
MKTYFWFFKKKKNNNKKTKFLEHEILKVGFEPLSNKLIFLGKLLKLFFEGQSNK